MKSCESAKAWAWSCIFSDKRGDLGPSYYFQYQQYSSEFFLEKCGLSIADIQQAVKIPEARGVSGDTGRKGMVTQCPEGRLMCKQMNAE